MEDDREDKAGRVTIYCRAAILLDLFGSVYALAYYRLRFQTTKNQAFYVALQFFWTYRILFEHRSSDISQDILCRWGFQLQAAGIVR